MDIELTLFVLACVFLFLVIGGVRIIVKRAREARSLARYNAVQTSGVVVPPTLHPVFDPARCIGSGACTHACPQGADVVGRIGGRGVLIDPSMCIGHGRCAAECPMGAIRLVFGTSERGVDIPHLRPTFETNVDGLYITGELGGMGLIANAIRQASEGMENIAASLKTAPGADRDVADVAIIGAGPAGLTSALAAKALGLTYRLFDKESEVGGAILHYPRRKIVMTHPVVLPLEGRVHRQTMTKEQLLALWRRIIDAHGVSLESGVSVNSITRDDEGIFTLEGSGVTARARRVMLAVGRRGTPRKLGVEGEAQSFVCYAMLESENHTGRRVLVVGGGDSAVEAACTLAEETDATVFLSYRKAALSRVKGANRERFDTCVEANRITPFMPSRVKKIGTDTVMLDIDGTETALPVDDVIVLIGGELPTEMLNRVGVRISRHFGEETEADRRPEATDIFERIRAQAKAAGLQNFHIGSGGPSSVMKWLVGLATAAVVGAILYLGGPYYFASVGARQSEARHNVFKATELFGHTLGGVAAVLIIFNLVYFLRKELKVMSGKGNIHSWIFLHQLSGIAAAAIVLLHTGFILNNAFAVALYVGLGITVVTGVVGRYIFAMVPLDPRGRPLTHEALVDLSRRVSKLYTALYGALDAAVEVRRILDLSYVSRVSFPGLLLRIFTTWPLRHLKLLGVIRRAKHEMGTRKEYHAFKQYSVEMFRLRLQMDLAPNLKGLLGYWRSGHAVTAAVLIALVAAHIAIEAWVGYRWIF